MCTHTHTQNTHTHTHTHTQECQELKTDKAQLLTSVAQMNQKLQVLEAHCRRLEEEVEANGRRLAEEQRHSQRAQEAANALVALQVEPCACV